MLRGKNAIITGANRGIGLATVETFAEHGARIWACARAKNEEFEAHLRDLSEQYSTRVEPLYFDVTDETAVKEAVKRIGKESETIDILVNNAGISVERLFGMTSISTVQNVLEVNYLSQLRLSQLVSRYMMKAKRGSIVNVASVAGMRCEPGGVAYGSSKAAVLYSTKTMAIEMGTYGIRVNSVSPGFIATDMWKARDEELMEKIKNETPLHRQGTPKEVANTILFLASDLSSFITGENIVVDGGRMGGAKNCNILLINSSEVI